MDESTVILLVTVSKRPFSLQTFIIAAFCFACQFRGSALCMQAQCQGLLKWDWVIIVVINYTCVLIAFPTMTSVNEKHLMSSVFTANFHDINTSTLMYCTLGWITLFINSIFDKTHNFDKGIIATFCLTLWL